MLQHRSNKKNFDAYMKFYKECTICVENILESNQVTYSESMHIRKYMFRLDRFEFIGYLNNSKKVENF